MNKQTTPPGTQKTTERILAYRIRAKQRRQSIASFELTCDMSFRRLKFFTALCTSLNDHENTSPSELEVNVTQW